MPSKHALIIGINKYPFMGPEQQLRGCVNDAKLMQKVLTQKFDFPPQNVVTLTDEQATGAAIRAQMDALTAKLQRDDIVVFHFSGHGHQCTVRTEFTTQGGGIINAILPHDDSEPADDGKIYREIRDHEMADWLDKIAAYTPFTTVIFDACYSGTMTRSTGSENALNEGASARFIASHSRPQSRASAASTHFNQDVVRSTQSDNVQSPDHTSGNWLARSEHYTVISACRDNQMAKGWSFNIQGEYIRHGVMSFFLARSLIRAKAKSSYRDVFENTYSGVVGMVKQQNPQIEGKIDREIFGTSEIEPLAFILVKDINSAEQTVKLDGGAAHGLAPGALWKIYPPKTKDIEAANCLASIKIQSVKALSATAEIVERFAPSDAPIETFSRAIEYQASPIVQKLKVNIKPLIEDTNNANLNAKIDDLINRINHSNLVELSESYSSTDIHIQLVAFHEVAQNLLADNTNSMHIETGLPLLLALHGDSQMAMPLHSVNSPNAANIVVENLEKIAKFRNVMLLDNAQSKLDVAFNLYKLTENGPELANDVNVFEETEPMSIEVQNMHGERVIYFNILWLSADRQILQFYPHNRASELLAPGQKVRIGDLSNRLSASFPPTYTEKEGSETIKVIFTSKETDFTWVNQSGLRSSEQQPTFTAFDQAFTGEAEPTLTEHDEESLREVEHDWCSVSRSFILKRKD